MSSGEDEDELCLPSFIATNGGISAMATRSAYIAVNKSEGSGIGGRAPANASRDNKPCDRALLPLSASHKKPCT